jgi:isoleucyl-tRNA synthetase
MAEENKNPLVAREHEIQKFWEDNKIFEKSLEATKSGKVFSFYDGPPFATGTAHYGHLVPNVMKDVIPRYQTMRGNYVERRWGWDCHGLPVENLIEEDLNLKSRKDIEDIGIDTFNNACRSSVLKYADAWKTIIPRFGRWVDMDADYRTMEPWYMESIWWVFKELWDKDLIYEGHKAMHMCPRCETTLSNFEVTQGYKDVKDLAVTAKFELSDEAGTFILAWTTTPWTLVGNVALAVGEDIEYVKIKFEDQTLILAKDLVEKVMEGKEYEVVDELAGKKLVGKKYKPLFDYYLDVDIDHQENLYTIVSADFVSTLDGVGIVHIAPAFGEDDMNLGVEKDLPMIQHVDTSGHFKPEVKDFPGLEVKPVDDTQKTDVEIIKNLAGKGLLFSKEKYEHSYPHCWRCDTPLLNYATSSWFVDVSKIKKDLIANNKKVNWTPDHLKAGRFGKWLEDARDWAISRSRFWGAPLPVWRCECGEDKVVGSIDELDNLKIDSMDVYTMRHGESEKNVHNVFSNALDKYPLTDNGRKMALASAKKLSENKIDLVISSEVLRAKQTAEIVAKELGTDIVFDARLNEVDPGDLNDQPDKSKEALDIITAWQNDHEEKIPGGESAHQVEDRMFAVWKEISAKYKGKNILLVSHGDSIRLLQGRLMDIKESEIFEKLDMIQPGEFIKLGERTSDLHKDVVDSIEFVCEKCGKNMKRVPEVLDCWFESGSMPYAQLHYPFENKDKFKDTYPADFIAEGVDQTRGWFYTLMILSTALYNKPAFKNVIANGIVMSEDGTVKLSKKLKNYPDPETIMDKYGADSLRLYLLSSPVMVSENINFSENNVKEAFQKVVMLTNNVLKFYKLYEHVDIEANIKSKNVLDKWLISKLNILTVQVTEGLDSYQLARATRPIQGFIDEFSTWWLRRSRDRFKSGDEKDRQSALSTFKYVLLEMSKVMAPFTPFLSEHIYKDVGGELESVHLDKWPKAGKVDDKLVSAMDSARKVVEMGLAARAEHGIKIRQPLSLLSVIGYDLSDDLASLIADELNVKQVKFAKGSEIKVELDIELTPELKVEGMVRELVRTINSQRKKDGLTIDDQVTITWQSDGKIINQVLSDDKLVSELKSSTVTSEFISRTNDAKSVKINGEEISLFIQKL